MILIERNTDVRIKCHKCGNEYAMDMMRIDPNSKNLACRNCLERKISSNASPEKSKMQRAEESKMKEYFCKACKYNFKRAKHLAVSACPYCNSRNVISKGSTARIIADAARMKGD